MVGAVAGTDSVNAVDEDLPALTGLDVAAVVEVTQALSAEMAFEPLVERLLSIAVERSGATRGALVLAREGALTVQAQAALQGETVSVATPAKAAIAETVVRHVAARGEPVVAADGTAAARFPDDATLAAACPQSILCLPLVKRKQLLGVLYLENDGAPRAFTPRRVALLEIIAAQGAISLANARLHRELQTALDDLKRAEAALRRSHDLLSEGQRASHTGSFTWDPASGDIGWSPETYRIYEIEPSEKPTLKMVTGRTHPEDTERTRGFLERAARDGLDWQDERRLVMPDGRIKYVHVIAHALHLGSRVTFAGAVKDVTATKREEERLQRAVREKGAILKEVHHRVKNNLQFISSLLSLEAARSSNHQVVQLFAEIRSRLRAMALVHENLYRAGDFGEVPMAAHVARLCEELVRAYHFVGQQVEVTAACSDLHLDMDRAMSLGLIINELVANSFKHAFPGGRAGHVFVDLSSADGRHCKLSVGDDGVSLPTGMDVGRTGSLGLQLVRDLVDQLHGTLAISREHGTTFTIDFDADGGSRARPRA